MKGKIAGLISLLTTMLVFVGTLGTATPTCIGWFYQPKVPKELKEHVVIKLGEKKSSTSNGTRYHAN